MIMRRGGKSHRNDGGERNVLFVHPMNPEERSHILCPAYWAAVLKGLTPDNWRTDFVNTGFEPVTDKMLERNDVLALSLQSSSSREAYAIADRARAMGKHVVFGGMHTFLFPGEAEKHCDTMMTSEAEAAWPRFLKDYERGRVQSVYAGGIVSPEDFVVPDYSITMKYPTHVRVMLETMRGCPFNCVFCTATFYTGSKYRYFPEAKIREQVERWCEGRFMPTRLANNNILADTDKSRRVLEILSEYNFKWHGPCSTNLLRHPDLLPLLAEAGATHLRFGMESMSPDTLKYLNKTQNMIADYKRLVRMVHDHGISVGGNFMFGMDTDTTDGFRATEEFIMDADIDTPLYGALIPFPGTEIFEQFHAEGRILTYDWSNYSGQHIVYEPKRMTRAQLADGIEKIYDRTHTPHNVIRRLGYGNTVKERVMSATMAGVMVFGKNALSRFFKDARDEVFEDGAVLTTMPNRSPATFDNWPVRPVDVRGSKPS